MNDFEGSSVVVTGDGFGKAKAWTTSLQGGLTARATLADPVGYQVTSTCMVSPHAQGARSCALIGGERGALKVWDLNTGQSCSWYSQALRNQVVSSIAASPPGGHRLTALATGMHEVEGGRGLGLYDLFDSSQAGIPAVCIESSVFQGGVHSMTFSKSSPNYLYVGAANGAAYLFDVRRAAKSVGHTPTPARRAPRSIWDVPADVRNDSEPCGKRRKVSCSEPSSMCFDGNRAHGPIYDKGSREYKHIFTGHQRDVTGILPLQDGRHVVTSDSGGHRLWRWSISGGDAVGVLEYRTANTKVSNAVPVGPGMELVACASGEGGVDVWETMVADAAFSNSGSNIVSRPAVNISINARTRPDKATALTSSEDGSMMICGCESGALHVLPVLSHDND